MERNNGQTIFLSVIGIATLLVAIIGATFAYFSTTMTGDATNTYANATSAQLAQVTFTGWDTAVQENDILPGKVIVDKQPIHVIAAGNMSGTTINYTCTATRTADAGFDSFEYKFSNEENGGTWTTNPTTVLEGSLATSNEDDTYYVSVRFNETGSKQNATTANGNETAEAGKTGRVAVSCALTNSVMYYNDANKNGTTSLGE